MHAEHDRALAFRPHEALHASRIEIVPIASMRGYDLFLVHRRTLRPLGRWTRRVQSIGGSMRGWRRFGVVRSCAGAEQASGWDVAVDAVLGVVRILLGALFVMTGAMKFAVPRLRQAWSVQLRLAKLPFYNLTFWLLPVVELVVGGFLILGLLTRLAAIAVVGMMLAATYVHLVVDDPNAFPLQPNEPIIPLVVIALAIVVLIGGSGSWSVG